MHQSQWGGARGLLRTRLRHSGRREQARHAAGGGSAEHASSRSQDVSWRRFMFRLTHHLLQTLPAHNRKGRVGKSLVQGEKDGVLLFLGFGAADRRFEIAAVFPDFQQADRHPRSF